MNARALLSVLSAVGAALRPSWEWDEQTGKLAQLNLGEIRVYDRRRMLARRAARAAKRASASAPPAATRPSDDPPDLH